MGSKNVKESIFKIILCQFISFIIFMPTFSGGIIYSASPQHLSWRGHVPPVPPSPTPLPQYKHVCAPLVLAGIELAYVQQTKSIGTKMNDLDLCLEFVQDHVDHCGVNISKTA